MLSKGLISQLQRHPWAVSLREQVLVASPLDMLQQLPLMSVGSPVYSSKKIRQHQTTSCPSDTHPQLPMKIMRPSHHHKGWRLVRGMEMLPGPSTSSSPWAPPVHRVMHPQEILPHGKDPGDGSPFLLTDADPGARRENWGQRLVEKKHLESLNKPPFTLISNLPMPYVQ